MQCVLIVDDNTQNLYYLEVLLQGNGFEARTAFNGAEALDSARDNPPDLIISDILMPVMDGFALCREWRADERLGHIPFIFYTATFTEPKDEALAMKLGCDRFLVKPMEPDALMEIIREALSASPSGVISSLPGSFRSESDLLREYNEALVRKLEKKMLDLEQVNRQLICFNDELEERVRLRTRELEDKVAELNAFTSAVSHDLRTPMRHLRCYSQILVENLEGRLEDDDLQMLQKIDQKSAAAVELVETLLELARLGNTDVVREEVDLSTMATGILEELSTAEPDRRYQLDVADALRVHADRQLTHIVMSNLLGNAWKYSANRQETRISVSATPGDDGDIICISDNGAGFDMAYAERLFVPFQRLHGEDEFSGVGIGLATVNSIVRRHGGRIWAESEPDKGAKFSFTLGNRVVNCQFHGYE